MNLLKDPFISTNHGKVSLKEILTTDTDYQLQYFFDEIQLAMLQMLASLTTVVLKPTVAELKGYLAKGITAEQYDAALSKIETKWFEGDSFMQAPFPPSSKLADAPITKLVSGIECGSSANALGLFSESEDVSIACSDCIHVLNYNLHMNIKGECFGPTGATGIRGGGAISTLVSGKNLKETLLLNTIAVDFYQKCSALNEDAENRYMWDLVPNGDIYQAQTIGLQRGLFALAYSIDFPLEENNCHCHICGQPSQLIAKTFRRVKFSGSYGSTKKGRDGGAGWWLHPFTPISKKDDGIYAVCARDQHWQSWQELTSYIVGKESENVTVSPAFVIQQYQNVLSSGKANILVGGNIADQGSITGRIYDLFSMPSTLSRNNSRISVVVKAGLEQKEALVRAFEHLKNKELNYSDAFLKCIKDQTMRRFVANAQQIIQQILLDVDRKEATELRKDAISALNKEANDIYKTVQRKYQYDLPLFKALVKGERALYNAQYT